MNNTRKRIILVDDVMANLDQGRKMLKTFYEVFPALSAAKMFEILEDIIPDMILLDIEMPDMDGYETIKKLKADERYAAIPVIFVTAKDDTYSEIEGFDLGAADYVTKPFSAPVLLKRIEMELDYRRQEKELLQIQSELKINLDDIEQTVFEKAEVIMQLQNAIFSTVVDMVEFRDEITGGHVKRTQQYLKVLLDEMIKEGMYEDQIKHWDMTTIISSAKLHDVGKIAVPDIILGKDEKLSMDEYEAMKDHVTLGVDIIERIMKKTEECDYLIHALRLAGTHHEKWDGSGYPMGLKGHNIPLEGQLMAIADVYDALVSKRSYKEAFTHEEACKIIEEGAGTQFNPELVEVFKNVEDKFAKIVKEIDNSNYMSYDAV